MALISRNEVKFKETSGRWGSNGKGASFFRTWQMLWLELGHIWEGSGRVKLKMEPDLSLRTWMRRPGPSDWVL